MCSPRGRPTNFWDFTDAQTWALVELATGDVLREGSANFPIESAALSPDGRRLALGGQPLEIIDLSSGRTLSSNQGSAATQLHVSWSPDGSTVVSAGDGRAHLWDGSTGEPLGDVAFGGDASPLFLSDSRTVLIPSYDGAVYKWDISVDHALEVACRVGGGGLSRQEWSPVLPEQPFEETCRSG